MCVIMGQVTQLKARLRQTKLRYLTPRAASKIPKCQQKFPLKLRRKLTMFPFPVPLMDLKRRLSERSQLQLARVLLLPLPLHAMRRDAQA